MQIGSLFVVPYTGGTIGRLPECEVYLDDVNVSKKHAKFGYNQDEKSFTIIDLGSRNGTFIHLVSYLIDLSKSEIINNTFYCRSVFLNLKKLVMNTF